MAKPTARKGDTVQHIGKPAAPITEGSPDVLINGLPAARRGDKSPHGGNPEPIVQGSGSVLINGMNAARVDDQVACGGPVITGSANVYIGDGAAGKACSMCPGGVAVGKPVNPILGAKVLSGPEDLDFDLPGALPLVWQRDYANHGEATTVVADYIVGFYNTVRLRSKLGNLPPNAYEHPLVIKQPIGVSEKT